MWAPAEALPVNPIPAAVSGAIGVDPANGAFRGFGVGTTPKDTWGTPGTEVGTVPTDGTDEIILRGPCALVDAALEGAFHGLPVCHGSAASTVTAISDERIATTHTYRSAREYMGYFIVVEYAPRNPQKCWWRLAANPTPRERKGPRSYFFSWMPRFDYFETWRVPSR